MFVCVILFPSSLETALSDHGCTQFAVLFGCTFYSRESKVVLIITVDEKQYPWLNKDLYFFDVGGF